VKLNFKRPFLMSNITNDRNHLELSESNSQLRNVSKNSRNSNIENLKKDSGTKSLPKHNMFHYENIKHVYIIRNITIIESNQNFHL